MDEEILGGLKSALERGESLKKAMMTFFNAGYENDDIEEAAKSLTEPVIETRPQIPVIVEKKPIPPPEPSPKIYTPKKIQQKVSDYGERVPSIYKPVPQPVQKVSTYEGEKNTKEKKIILILSSLLVFLIGILISIFLFKEQLINFFNGLFS